MTDNEDRTCSCDCVTLRRRLAELREEQREIAALFGIAPCDEDRPPTWTNGERGWMTLREALRPFAAALDANNEADRMISGLLRVIGWQSDRDRELSEEEADLILEIAATQPVSEEEHRRLQEGVLRRRFGTTAARAQPASETPAGDER